MAKTVELKLLIEAILKDKGLIDAKAKVGDLEKQVAGLKGKLEGAAGASRGFSDALKSAIAPIAAALTVQKLTAFVYEAAEAQREMERRTNALTGTLQQLGLPVEKSMAQINEFTASLAELTGVVDDDSIPALQQFVGLTGNVEAAMVATKVAALLSSEGFGTFGDTVAIVANLMAGKVDPAAKSLGIAGKAMAESWDKPLKVFDILIERVNNSAAAMVENEGATAHLSAAWDRFGDAVGDGARVGLGWVKDLLTGMVNLATRGADAIQIAGFKIATFWQRAIASRDDDTQTLIELDWQEAALRESLEQKYTKARVGSEKVADSEIVALRKAMADLLKNARDKQLSEEQKAAEAAAQKNFERLTKESEARYKIKEQDRKRTSALEADVLAKSQEIQNAQLEATARDLMKAYFDEAMGRKALAQAERDDEQAVNEERLINFRGTLAEQLRLYADYLAEKRDLDIAQAEADMEAEIAAANGTESAIAAARQKYATKVRGIRVKEAKDQDAINEQRKKSDLEAAQYGIGVLAQAFPQFKAFAIAQAVIDTYAGADKALAQGGFWGMFMAAAVIAAGLANVARISSQDTPMAQGGIVTGPTRILAGEAGVPEAFIPLNDRGARFMREMVGGDGGGGVIVNMPITLNAVTGDERTLRRFGRQLSAAQRRDLERLVR